MAVRALSLSGGAARGSFQLGALIARYEVYGFRPDINPGGELAVEADFSSRPLPACRSAPSRGSRPTIRGGREPSSP
jgi:hypothetical protein